jgi:hypothetical protein
MAERFFHKIVNDVLEASEKLTVRLEDGITALMTGKLPSQDKGAAPSVSEQASGADQASSEVFEDELEMLEEDHGGSPLEGIARSVIGDIMDKQVSFAV